MMDDELRIKSNHTKTKEVNLESTFKISNFES